MTSPKLPRRPTINGAGVLVLGGAAFVLSYDTLYRLALRIGFPDRLAWLWPLTIDGFIVYASDEALHRARTGKRWQAAYGWLLVLCATGGSAAFQVATAPPTVLSRIGHAVPPVALLLAFEIRRRRVAEHQVAKVPAGAAGTGGVAGRQGVLDRPHPPSSSGTRAAATPRRKPTPSETDTHACSTATPTTRPPSYHPTHPESPIPRGPAQPAGPLGTPRRHQRSVTASQAAPARVTNDP